MKIRGASHSFAPGTMTCCGSSEASATGAAATGASATAVFFAPFGGMTRPEQLRFLPRATSKW